MAETEMTLNEYQRVSMRTAIPMPPLPHPGTQFQLSGFGLGIAGEAGEVADDIKKFVHHEHPYTEEHRQKMKKELGDVLWYLSGIADRYGFTLEEIAVGNIEKLAARYPNGWTREDSINRNNE